jgi:hypothetical protein
MGTIPQGQNSGQTSNRACFVVSGINKYGSGGGGPGDGARSRNQDRQRNARLQPPAASLKDAQKREKMARQPE